MNFVEVEGDGGPRLVKVRCPDHSELFRDGLFRCFQTKNGVDTDICWGGHWISAHRIILELFMLPETLVWMQAGGSERESADEDVVGMNALLEFVYRGEVSVPEEQLEGLLGTARQLNFQMLVDAVEYSAYENFKAKDFLEGGSPSEEPSRLTKSAPKVRIKVEKDVDVDFEDVDIDYQEGESSHSSLDHHWVSEDPCATSDLVPKMVKTEEDDVGLEDNDVPHSLLDRRLEELVRIGEIDRHPTDDTEVHIKEKTLRRSTKSVLEKPFICPLCDFETIKRNSKLQHLLQIHGVNAKLQPMPRLACSQPGCDFTAVYQNDVNRHLVSKHGTEKAHKCPHCPLAYNRAADMNRHLDVSHGEGPGRYTCGTCDRRFVSNFKLVQHRRKHTKERPFKCGTCGATFADKGSLTQHETCQHGQGDYQYTCQTCGRRCQSRYDMERHERTHTKEKPFKCQHCSSSFGAAGTLKKHVDVVHGIGTARITCETCGKRCASKANLIIHNRSHTKERPFECPHCNATFNHKQSCVKHIASAHGSDRGPAATGSRRTRVKVVPE